tara:strand:- start:132924 stop:133046 length:123 start_codon:yes stop_codon:yes gene_type:complete
MNFIFDWLFDRKRQIDLIHSFWKYDTLINKSPDRLMRKLD